jgi:hypothetical protein
MLPHMTSLDRQGYDRRRQLHEYLSLTIREAEGHASLHDPRGRSQTSWPGVPLMISFPVSSHETGLQ